MNISQFFQPQYAHEEYVGFILFVKCLNKKYLQGIVWSIESQQISRLL